MAQAEKEQNQPQKNPIIWVSLIVVGLIIFIFIVADRESVTSEDLRSENEQQIPQVSTEAEGQIARDEPPPPGKRARELIQTMRKEGKPYPFDELMAKASSFA